MHEHATESLLSIEENSKSESKGIGLFSVLSSSEEIASNTLVRFSSFERIKHAESGGVISYAYNAPLEVEFCRFVECSSEANGGSIYVSSDCNYLVYCVCSYRSRAKSAGQFIYSNLGNTFQSQNYVHRSSICSTSESEYQGHESPIRCEYGNRECKSVNISNNYVTYHSAIYYVNGDRNNKNNIEYCSINNNHASEWICLWFGTSGVSYRIDHCNIHHNGQPTSSVYGIIYSNEATVTLTNCCLEGNTGGKLFSTLNSGAKLTVSDCYINQDVTQTGTVIVNPTVPEFSINLDTLLDDCSHIVRVNCNTKDCNKRASPLFSIFGNLYVFCIMLTNNSK